MTDCVTFMLWRNDMKKNETKNATHLIEALKSQAQNPEDKRSIKDFSKEFGYSVSSISNYKRTLGMSKKIRHKKTKSKINNKASANIHGELESLKRLNNKLIIKLVELCGADNIIKL